MTIDTFTFTITELTELPLGLLVVMPRVQLMTEGEFNKKKMARFCEKEDYFVPAELKHNSFGWLDGNIVCIDYGN